MTKHITTFAYYTPETEGEIEPIGYEAGSLDEPLTVDEEMAEELDFDALREAEIDEAYFNLAL